jgi:hypothetical protein
MKKMILLSLATTCCIATTANATENRNPTGQGAGALQFNLDGIAATPGVASGVGIGAIYFVGENLALRGRLGLSVGSKAIDYGSGRPDDEESATALGLEGGVEYVLVKAGNLNIWTGGTIGFGTGNREAADKTETAEFRLRLMGLLGADWFFSENVSLGAEYNLGVSNSSLEVNPMNGPTKDVTTETIFGVASGGLRLGFWW